MAKRKIENIEVIESCYGAICEFSKKKDAWANDKAIIELLNIMHGCLHAEIHSKLSSFMSEQEESHIRSLIRRYVIGCKDVGKVWFGAIDIIQNKVRVLCSKKKKNEEIESYIKQYIDLEDDFFALAAIRSFKHFCLYMEKDKPALAKTWKPTVHLFDGWYYYANKMVLDGDVQFIEKQLPTGYGKSYSDTFLIAWIFGQDINADVIKVFGNKYNCPRMFDGLVEIMTTPKYAKVFPYYAQFNCKKNFMFESCREKDGELKITGSTKPINLLVVGKESKISGVRAKYLFLDDITQAEDAAKISMHDKDINTFLNVWFKRNYGMDNFYIVASGTTYSCYDILSWLKNRYGHANAINSKVNKYTMVAKCNDFVYNGTSVFVCVPKLDYVTDESTFPERFPTVAARKQRADDYETFMAMEQQQPQKPKDNPFYLTALMDYETLPEKNTHDRGDFCWAYLDAKRKGADFCAMPILTPIGNLHYLVDVFYDNRPMKELYGGIIAKIKHHHITKLVIENNINEGLKTLLQKMLFEQGVTFCEIVEIFNYTKKELRIAGVEFEIKQKIVFPKFGLYARSSPIGQAMDELYGYTYNKKVEHDDFTDAIAGYVENFVAEKNKNRGKISFFGR